LGQLKFFLALVLNQLTKWLEGYLMQHKK